MIRKKDFKLLRLSLQAFFNLSLEQLEWYGRGPIENYRDRKNAAYVGKYQSTVKNMKESFDFSALYYTDKDLFEIKYGHALPDVYRAEVVLNLDISYVALF